MSTENSVTRSLKTRSLQTKFGTCSIATTGAVTILLLFRNRFHGYEVFLEVYRNRLPYQSDNDWIFIGEPETSVSCNRPATVEMTCGTLINRIPQLIDAPAGYVTTDQYPYNEYCVHPLNTYVKSM